MEKEGNELNGNGMPWLGAANGGGGQNSKIWKREKEDIRERNFLIGGRQGESFLKF